MTRRAHGDGHAGSGEGSSIRGVPIPRYAKPGETVLDIDLGDGAVFSVLVPAQARCGDILAPRKNHDGELVCTLIRLGGTGSRENQQDQPRLQHEEKKLGQQPQLSTELQGEERAHCRELTLQVPENAVPGVTSIATEVAGGQKVRCIVPENAMPGQWLQFTEAPDGSWSCVPAAMAGRDDHIVEEVWLCPPPADTPLEPQAADGGGADVSSSSRASDGSFVISCEIPATDDVVPGSSKLELESDTPGKVLRLVVPSRARAGDILQLRQRASGGWDVAVCHQHVEVQATNHYIFTTPLVLCMRICFGLHVHLGSPTFITMVGPSIQQKRPESRLSVFHGVVRKPRQGIVEGSGVFVCPTPSP